MPRMPKADANLTRRITQAATRLPAYEKRMFGSTSWFAESNRQMFAGVWGDGLMVRVGEGEATRLVETGQAQQIAPMGRPMKEYVLVAGGSVSSESDLADWLSRAAAFAETLPAKKK